MRAAIRSLRDSPAASLYLLVWVLSAGFLALSGFPQQALFGLFDLLGLGILGYFTFRLTVPAPATARPSAPARRRLLLQLLVISLVILLTGYRGAVFHDMFPGAYGLPLWTSLERFLGELGAEWTGNANFIANPVLYFVLPFFALLLLGARPLELGFGPGHKVWQVTLLWSLLPLGVIAYTLVIGQVRVEVVLLRLLSNSLQNGFFEEFLFRGALQTRLRRFFTPGWAMVLQALVFGAWHLGLGYSATGSGALLPALLSTIVIQSVLGLGFGLIFERTRNLVAPSIVHVLLNSMGI
jgi:membrane protease YdiL (CAAX protease family)